MKNFIIFLILLFVSSECFSQTFKPTGTTYAETISSPNSDPKVAETVKNLKVARMNEDAVAKKYWESKLHELTKPEIINAAPHNFIYKNEFEDASDASGILNMTTITNEIVVANAVSRERLNGYIYAVVGIYGGPVNTDTLRIYRSTNNGLNFTPIFTFYETFKIVDNGIDVEAVSKGDSSYVFVSMDYRIGIVRSSVIFRVRQDGNMFQLAGLFGGAGANSYYNGRITSDNATYLGLSYLYYSVTLDSNVAGTRRLRSKLYRIENPFATALQLISCYQNPTTGNYGYYVDGAAPVSAKFESDVAFVNTSSNTDLIYTVTVVSGVPGFFNEGTSYYFTRSADYGVTVPSLFSTPNDPPRVRESPRIASPGYLNNSVMVLSRRLFSGGDWDPYYSYAADINSQTFVNGYVDASVDTTMGVSVTARYRSNGSYLFAYNNRFGENASMVYIRPFNSGTMGTNVQANPPSIWGTNFYGYPDAAFRNVNNDSCLVIWAGIAGFGSYVTGGCDGPITNTGSNENIVSDYNLFQNYPNPFNPVTNISFSLPKESKVTLKVFDLSGREVELLVNEIRQPGYHTVKFNGDGSASGVYFYSMVAESNDSQSDGSGQFTMIKKMILLK